MRPRHRRPKLAVVVPSLTHGGGVAAVARFIKDTVLRDKGFELQLVSLATSSKDPASLNLTQVSTWLRGATTTTGVWCGLPHLHVGAVAGELESQRLQSRKVLTDALGDCDIIQVVCGSPAWANAVCGLGKPVAVQCATRARVERRLRDRSLRGPAGIWRKMMTEVTDHLDDKALRTVDAIQVENPWMLEYARKINSGRDVDLRYAPPGVDAEMFHPLPDRNLVVDPYILCVGRLDDPRKNIVLLLEAYGRFPRSLTERVRLVLAGSSGPPDSFWQRAKELGVRDRVTYIAQPQQEVLVTLYQKALVFALPSDEEGLGVVLLEAMACGVPVVSTRSGGPEGIIADGKDGFLVALDDASAMAQRLTLLCGDSELNQQMGRHARATIEARYADVVAGQAFIDVWHKLLEKAGEPRPSA